MKKFIPLLLISLSAIGNIGPFPGGGGGGGSGVDTVGPFSASAQTNGASISGTTITFGPSNASTPGMVSTGAQTMAGVKTFSSAPVMSTLTGSKAVLTTAGSALSSSSYGESDWVLTSTDQTVGGVKTFSSAPIVSTLSTSSPVFTNGSSALTSTGTVGVANGGTGAATLTANNVILGNGTSAVQFVAPTVSGNLLTAVNGTWVSQPPSAAGVSGSGTTGRFTKFSSSSAVTSSLWKEGANGEFVFTNYASAKGTAAAPLVDIIGDGVNGTGIFTNSGGYLNLASGGAAAALWDGNGMTLYQLGTPTKFFSFLVESGDLLVTSSGVNQVLKLKGKDTSTVQEFRMIDSSANTLWGVETYGAGQSSIPFNWYMKNVYGYNIVKTRGGMGMGANIEQKLNGLTIVPDSVITTGRGTTTANASTTISGSSTFFTLDFGINDLVALSSASTTYARVTAIASDTSMTVDTALGNGTSQTFLKKQSPFRVANASGAAAGQTTYLQVDPLGRLALNSTAGGPNTGQATCNGTTEVTVSSTIVTASSKIFYSPNAAVVTTPWTSTRTAGTSFGFKCGGGDTATVDWFMIEPY